jgi:hypothetical protein
MHSEKTSLCDLHNSAKKPLLVVRKQGRRVETSSRSSVVIAPSAPLSPSFRSRVAKRKQTNIERLEQKQRDDDARSRKWWVGRSILSSSSNISLLLQYCRKVFMFARIARDTHKNTGPGDAATRSFFGAFEAGGCSQVRRRAVNKVCQPWLSGGLSSLTLLLRLAQPKCGPNGSVKTERNEREKPIWGRN